MNDQDAVGPLEEAVWGLFSHLGRGDGGSVIDTATRLVVRSPVRQAPYNGVFRFLDDGRPMADQVADTLALFEREVPVTWLVHPTSPASVEDALTAAGLVEAEDMPGMVADLATVPALGEPPEGVRIEEAGLDRADAWVHLVSWRYGLESTASGYLEQVYRHARTHGTRLWIAYDGDEPISKAASYTGADFVGVFGVATTEAGRGKGLARHLTLRALHAAADDGIGTAVLHSTPMAHSLYRKMGFRDVARFRLWTTPGDLEL
ncbi:MAG: GNAT family N-acetyltransferase [Actinomycetota bacterium]